MIDYVVTADHIRKCLDGHSKALLERAEELKRAVDNIEEMRRITSLSMNIHAHHNLHFDAFFIDLNKSMKGLRECLLREQEIKNGK